MSNDHALLSPSGAHRWMECPGSVKMEACFPDTENEFANYGTRAHLLAERCLREDLTASYFLGNEIYGGIVDTEMTEGVQTYMDYVRNIKGKKLFERKFTLSRWIPDGHGTCDCIVLSGSILYVIDLKFGKGVKVYAEKNPQLSLYALGAIDNLGFLLDTIKDIRLVIVQPRLDHISEYRTTKTDLMRFGNTVKKRAKAALSSEDPPLIPGEAQCRFCKARATCRALADYCLTTASAGFEDTENPSRPVDLLSNREISEILPKLKLIEAWMKALKEKTLQELMGGKEIPGYKLVEGRSIRKWKDESEMVPLLVDAGLTEEELFESTLVSPAKAERILGRDHKIIKDCVVKPRGALTFAPEEDSRKRVDLDPTEGFKSSES